MAKDDVQINLRDDIEKVFLKLTKLDFELFSICELILLLLFKFRKFCGKSKREEMRLKSSVYDSKGEERNKQVLMQCEFD